MVILYIFVLGLCIGSFANVLIDRLPFDQSINGRSHCDQCKKQLHARDLFPVLSFIFLKGRSRCCNTNLSWQYPLVELITGILFVGVFLLSTQSILAHELKIEEIITMLLWTGISVCLLVIFITDVKYQIIPDEMQVVLASLSLLLQLMYVPHINTLIDSMMAGAVVMLPILAIYAVTKGRGMGFGDVKLAVCMGLLLGIKGGLIALYLAFLVGAAVGLVLIFGKRLEIKSKIAFGPFLITGIVGVLIWGEQLKDLVYKLYGV